MRLINKKNQAKPPLQKCARQRQRKVMLLILIIIQHAAGAAGQKTWMGDAISWPIYFLYIYQLLLGCGVCAQGQGVATFFLFNTTPYTYSYFNRDFAAENLNVAA